MNNNIIDRRLRTPLTTKFPRTSNFYLLPKIHKTNNPGRPIVNSIGSPTERISAFIDDTLKPLASQVPSFIKDTTDFLNTIKDLDIDREDILLTIDVSALYTNIPHNEGIAAIRRWMTIHHIDTEKRDLICTLTDRVLKNNCFEFDGSIYIQQQGTAMGTRMAPNYAIIFMHMLEEQLLAINYPLPSIWKRFIDDIFVVWKHGEDNLKTFLSNINNHHPTIKFTWEYSTKEIPFLDTIVYKNGNKLGTRIYHKPTDNKQYLHFESSHPRRQKESVPYGLLIRSKRICTKDEDFNHEATNILEKLRKRKYPEILLQTCYTKVNQMNRNDLLKPKNKPPTTKIRCITAYNQQNPNMNDIIRKYRDHLSLTRKKAISPDDIEITYSRSINLRDSLIKGNLLSISKPRICSPCNKPCKTCPRIETNMAVTGHNNISYKIRGSFTCQSNDIVYHMECTICHKKYIGESSNTLNTRCRGHESAIRRQQEHPVAQHFSDNNHTETDYKIMAIDKCATKNNRLRLEEAWMILLNTLHPDGLNARL
jgi:hypothetical protein